MSLSTAWHWMHKEGFQYISYAKGLYYDGHDCSNVVEYRQSHFLPMLKQHKPQLVRYVTGDEDKEADNMALNYVEWHLVMAPHDETTSQANDSHDKGWVCNNKFSLWKKGQGCGLHESGAICRTVGYLNEGQQTLEYGKNYDGYWTGELFINQVCSSYIVLASKCKSNFAQSAQREVDTCFWSGTWAWLSGLILDW